MSLISEGTEIPRSRLSPCQWRGTNQLTVYIKMKWQFGVGEESGNTGQAGDRADSTHHLLYQISLPAFIFSSVNPKLGAFNNLMLTFGCSKPSTVASSFRALLLFKVPWAPKSYSSLKVPPQIILDKRSGCGNASKLSYSI